MAGLPRTHALLLCAALIAFPAAAVGKDIWPRLAPFFSPPAEYAGRTGNYRSPLVFDDGRPVKTPDDWRQRRAEILAYWHKTLGPWPPLLEKPAVDILAEEQGETFTRQRVRIQISPRQSTEGYVLIPPGNGPFPAVLVVFYEPRTSVGLNPDDRYARLDFARQLTRRGFLTLSIGSPGTARQPHTDGAACQPLSFLAYVAANCHTAMSAMSRVDGRRIGIMGHSYGGKWAMFAACLHDKFAAAAWSDPGIVFDETRPNVNYWEPWYLGYDPAAMRKPGVPSPDNPRTGPYAKLKADGRDLHELHALMAPRPFLVSGGSEDPPSRWLALNHSVAVNRLLGRTERVGMTSRPTHAPTDESNAIIALFFEWFLGHGRGD